MLKNAEKYEKKGYDAGHPGSGGILKICCVIKKLGK